MVEVESGRVLLLLSGAPGSGKSTLARRLAEALGWPCLDKDDFLEALFEERGVGDAAWRRALSREADARFLAVAQTAPRAVVCSWWRHPASGEASGTPVDGLLRSGHLVLELHCHCPAEAAAERFVQRRRHPGHLDARRDPADLLAQLRRAESLGPLGLGESLILDTTGQVDLMPALAWARSAIARARALADRPPQP
ncbi:ATP-binding protein [Chromobacterium sp. IIBBL 290-4]|uniref:AAA family ATPase n=1 Tax=Chromobacterium sp. IIBBL 290-4 TaxID=2953890 RepID=UPI0020B6E85F|nr:ATP-binding protein [Chromobacterium sp. IIBBL 290-4]UTH75952.1 ATP-binding protein [Chromobacterium sp. IIBBL 290-4]